VLQDQPWDHPPGGDAVRHTFPLSLRNVEDLLHERGVEISHEAIRCWTQKFDMPFARNLRRARPGPTSWWHLDEMVVPICGQRM
jgi:putative transposase